MATEQYVSRPYEDQELLSIDRLKRAVMNRIIERAEALMDVEFPLKDETAGAALRRGMGDRPRLRSGIHRRPRKPTRSGWNPR